MTDATPTEPKTIATPEGDNEGLPDQPLQPKETGETTELLRPRGDDPHSKEPLYPALETKV